VLALGGSSLEKHKKINRFNFILHFNCYIILRAASPILVAAAHHPE
jgi:hypothetical protein